MLYLNVLMHYVKHCILPLCMNKLAFTFQSTASHGDNLLVYEYKMWTVYIWRLFFYLVIPCKYTQSSAEAIFESDNYNSPASKLQSLRVDARVVEELMRCYISSSCDISTVCKQAAGTKWTALL